MAAAYKKWREKHDGKDVHNRDVILFLKAKDDHNDALSIPSPVLFTLTSQKKYPVVFKEISSCQDIQSAIEKMQQQNNRIHAIWINAHGDKSGVALSQTNDLATVKNSADKDYKLSRDRIKYSMASLDKNAVIVLESCSTGKVDGLEDPNIAQTVATITETHTVIAPTEDLNKVGARIRNLETMDVQFRGAKKSTAPGFLKKVVNVWNEALFIHSFGRYGRNITGRFRHYSPKTA